MDPLFTLAGLAVGICIGLTGVGGGALMTPILILSFGIPPLVAVGTDLLYAAFTKASGVWFHSRRGNVRWDLAGRLAMGSIPTSLFTAWMLGQFEQSALLEQVISVALGITLMTTSLVLLLRERLHRGALAHGTRLHSWCRRHRRGLLTALGALLGVLVTLSSVGAGALTAAMLFLLFPRMPALAVVGTDLIHAVPLTAIAGLGHLQLGSVDFTLLGSLLLGSIPGTALGSYLGQRVPETFLRRRLAGLLLIAGLKFAF